MMEEYIDEETGVSLVVCRDLESPWVHVTATGMDTTTERMNAAIQRLLARAGLLPEQNASE